MRPSVLIIYTGGTIGMSQRPEDGSLSPVNFDELSKEIPVLQKFGYNIFSTSFEPVLDSSNITPTVWVKLARIIQKNYTKYDGFVVLHGTDTMAYTASALSFMLENLSKPVVFTGAQLPIGMLRTDGKENLVTAVEIAAAKNGDKSIVPEVCIYFNSMLFRGNRTSKIDSQHFRAFDSKNYPALALAGVDISYHGEYINYQNIDKDLSVHCNIDTNVFILKLFPGIEKKMVDAVLNIEGIRGIIIESFGSGNVPNFSWFVKSVSDAVDRGIVAVNVSQCSGGRVVPGHYQTSMPLIDAGVSSGYDMTTEAALTKLMCLLGLGLPVDAIKKHIEQNLRGEITI